VCEWDENWSDNAPSLGNRLYHAIVAWSFETLVCVILYQWVSHARQQFVGNSWAFDFFILSPSHFSSNRIRLKANTSYHFVITKVSPQTKQSNLDNALYSTVFIVNTFPHPRTISCKRLSINKYSLTIYHLVITKVAPEIKQINLDNGTYSLLSLILYILYSQRH